MMICAKNKTSASKPLSYMYMAVILAISLIFPAVAEDAADKLLVIRKIMSERSEWDLAETQLNSFIKENQGNKLIADALLLLGYSQDKQKKDTLAISSYTRLIADFPNAEENLLINARLGAADANFRLGDYIEASKQYEALLEKFPSASKAESALLWLSEATYRQGGKENENVLAKEWYRKAADGFSRYIKTYPASKQIVTAV